MKAKFKQKRNKWIFPTEIFYSTKTWAISIKKFSEKIQINKNRKASLFRAIIGHNVNNNYFGWRVFILDTGHIISGYSN